VRTDVTSTANELTRFCCGQALFGRFIMQERFGEKDAVEFLKEQVANARSRTTLSSLPLIILALTAT